MLKIFVSLYAFITRFHTSPELRISVLFRCPVFSGIENSVPALCLICGAWCCCEGWCCREVLRGINVGSCTAHASRCGAGIGIFLRVQDCRVVLLNGIGKGCFHPSPYLDAYGETDPGLR